MALVAVRDVLDAMAQIELAPRPRDPRVLHPAREAVAGLARGDTQRPQEAGELLGFDLRGGGGTRWGSISGGVGVTTSGTARPSVPQRRPGRFVPRMTTRSASTVQLA